MAGPINDEASLAVGTSEPTKVQVPAYNTDDTINSRMLRKIASGSTSIIATIGPINWLLRLMITKINIGMIREQCYGEIRNDW